MSQVVETAEVEVDEVSDVSPGEAEDGAGTPRVGDGSNEGDGSERQVPVSEAIRYRKRAQQAERELEEARGRLGGLAEALSEAREVIDSLERRQKAASLLAEAEAVDMEAAMLLTEAAVSQMDEPDVAEAVSELRRRRPYLFRPRRYGTGGAMAARVGADDGEALDEVAAEASVSGDRRDLLRYLRMKRGG